MMFKKLSVVAAFAAVSTSVNGLSVLAPSSTWWWQTGDQALFAWDCTDRSHAQFAAVVTNTNTALLPAGSSILVGIQNNDQCTTNIVPQLNVGTGYTLQLTNIVNYTDIYATSEPFEVKAKGSPYPSGPTPSLTYSSTGTGTAQPTGSQSTNSGMQFGTSVAGAMAVAGGLLALLSI
ncbi:hypothetical protein CPB86DRAFT_869955 [Serendipita vermifera]|nr:hypothetical protein CPB86DRAFT_869955 [Serendipita vermifera]